MHNDTLHLLELCFLSSKSQQGREFPTTALNRRQCVKAWPPQSRLGLGYIEGMGTRWRLATGKVISFCRLKECGKERVCIETCGIRSTKVRTTQ